MSLTTSDISIALLMDTSVALEEIQSRIHARTFAAVMDPTKGPAGGGLDQSVTIGKRHHYGYVGDGCLTGRRGVIFPGSYRPRR